jgi:hypothetical protein
MSDVSDVLQSELRFTGEARPRSYLAYLDFSVTVSSNPLLDFNRPPTNLVFSSINYLLQHFWSRADQSKISSSLNRIPLKNYIQRLQLPRPRNTSAKYHIACGGRILKNSQDKYPNIDPNIKITFPSSISELHQLQFAQIHLLDCGTARNVQSVNICQFLAIQNG